MGPLSEAALSLVGAYRLAHFEARGMSYFNASVTGFWRSFLAAAIVAPFYALLLAATFPAGEDAPDPLRFALIEGIAYVTAWVAYPLIMLDVTERLGCRDRFLNYMVAYNWSNVLQNALFIPVNLASALGYLNPELGLILWVAVFILILVYVGFIACTALGVTPPVAAAIVFLDLLLNLTLSLFARSLEGG